MGSILGAQNLHPELFFGELRAAKKFAALARISSTGIGPSVRMPMWHREPTSGFLVRANLTPLGRGHISGLLLRSHTTPFRVEPVSVFFLRAHLEPLEGNLFRVLF
jgi:hypothetical protein